MDRPLALTMLSLGVAFIVYRLMAAFRGKPPVLVVEEGKVL
jgi:hypothetical protein